jgi:hypothetical protein
MVEFSKYKNINIFLSKRVDFSFLVFIFKNKQ